MTLPPCPICKRDAAPNAADSPFPFCSPRCRMADLGSWLDGSYRIAGTRTVDDDEELLESLMAAASEDGSS